MNPKEAYDHLTSEPAPVCCERAREVLLALLRRDWAVRVLDAWADVCDEQWSVRKETDDGDVYVVVLGFDEDEYHHGDTPAAARTLAALAVYPKLPADVRADLGECP